MRAMHGCTARPAASAGGCHSGSSTLLTAVPQEQERIPGTAIHKTRRLTVELLIQLYDSTGKKDKAAKYRKQLNEKNDAQDKLKP